LNIAQSSLGTYGKLTPPTPVHNRQVVPVFPHIPEQGAGTVTGAAMETGTDAPGANVPSS
jgi:hypothetical protein